MAAQIIPKGIYTAVSRAGPVWPGLEEIPRMRKALGLTQTALAKRAGVSQSAIVKIERRQMNPSYALAKRLFETLESERIAREARTNVDAVKTRVVRTGEAADTMESVARAMKRHGYSQMPVMDGKRAVGSVTDRTINDLILSEKTPRDLARIPVADVMGPPFPQVDGQAPVDMAAAMLRVYDAVLVTTRGEVSGIVTKSDLMKLL